MKTFMSMRSRSSQHGFTLIETIVAVMILSIAVTGPLYLASRTLRVSQDARNELIASHLAMEGIEVIHNIRDNNSADDTSMTRDEWMENPPLQIVGSCTSGCTIDITESSASDVWEQFVLKACASGDCSGDGKVYRHKTTGLYRQNNSAFSSDWEFTGFTRWIEVEGIDGPNPLREVEVRVFVTYTSVTGATLTTALTEHLFNWFPTL